MSPERSVTYVSGPDKKIFWRRGRDSNPRYPFRYGRFRGGSFQPLTHLSACSRLLVSACGMRLLTIKIVGALRARCYLLLRKKVCKTAEHSSARTPDFTSILWFNPGWFNT